MFNLPFPQLLEVVEKCNKYLPVTFDSAYEWYPLINTFHHNISMFIVTIILSVTMALPIDNPCPQQGDIVTIRLSENTEMVPKDDRANLPQAMLADTFFEMNYATGEWRRYKKYKPIQAL